MQSVSFEAIQPFIPKKLIKALKRGALGVLPVAATCAAAREIRDGDIVFCGTGISMLAAMAAKNISAPNSVIFFETGAIDSLLEEVPLAVSDSRVMFWTSVNGNLADAFAAMQNRFTGPHVVGIMGAAQIDKYGNLNSTAIGDYFKPKVRFSGSGGACDVASFVGRTITFMQHEKRKFVQKIDYITSPGWLNGPDGRKKAGLPAGITPQKIFDNMGFEIDVSRAKEVESPTESELKILRGK